MDVIASAATSALVWCVTGVVLGCFIGALGNLIYIEWKDGRD